MSFFSFLNPKGKSDFSILEEVIDASETGKVVFSRGGALVKANSVALDCLYPVTEEDLSGITSSQFFDYLYDSAEETDASIRNTILEQYKYRGDRRGNDFVEVVYSQNRGLHLVEAKQLDSGGVLFTLLDINKGRKREENIIQLSQYNDQLLQAIEAVTTGIIIMDPVRKAAPVLFVNDAFCQCVGKDKGALTQLNWGSLLSFVCLEEDRGNVVEAVEERREIEVPLDVNKGDRIAYYTFKLSPVSDDVDGRQLFIGVMTEITLLKQRETELFQAQKLESLGQLAAGVAHDFNNILSIIGGYSVMAKNFIRDGDGDERIKGFLDKITAASDRGAGLTRKMLTFSRHKVVSNSVVNVCSVVREQEDLLVPLLGVNIDLEVHYDEEEMNIRGSEDSLGQIVMNLAVNARDAMLNGGDLSIDVLAVKGGDLPANVRGAIGDADCVCVRISDNGMGMDQKTLDRIFDPFFTTKDQGKGTGLGLSVVYGLVNEIGGFMDVSSVLYEGTTMSCYLPRSMDKANAVVVGDEADLSTICLDGFTALVAEDEPDLLVLVTNMLEDMGLRVIGAENGNKALELADEYEDEIDILLTDVVMPEVNGVKLAELVTALNPDIKVIFMSGYPATGEMAPVELPDDVDFIAKPVDYDNLAVVLLRKLREGSINTAASEALDAIPQWKSG